MRRLRRQCHSSRLELGQLTRKRPDVSQNAARFRHCAVARPIPVDAKLFLREVLDREKQLGVVEELTEIVATAAGDPSLRERTWVLLTEAPEGGWGIAGHANTNADLVDLARAQLGKG